MTGKITGALREQSDWEQNNEHRLGFIKNKPFYDTRRSEPLTIEWDGNTEGRTVFPTEKNNVFFVKISDITPTLEEIAQGVFSYNLSTESFPMTNYLDLSPYGDKIINVYEPDTSAKDGVPPFILFMLEDVDSNGIKAEKGVYSIYTNDGFDEYLYVSNIRLSTTVGELKTIDPKFLPTRVINANEYGIDLPAIGISGQTQTLINDNRLFEEIGKQKDFIIECDYSGMKIALTPTSIIRNADGFVSMFTVTISVLMSGSMARMELTLMSDESRVLVNCVTTQTPL